MKIFISWSGSVSHAVARLLKDFISDVIQATDPWVSSSDIDKGTIWFSKILGELTTNQNGIICLTKENLNNPWILFESGALAKGIGENRVYTFLIDLEPSEIKDPLAQFNHTRPNKNDVLQLIKSINNKLGEKSLNDNKLEKSFDIHWQDFIKSLEKIKTEIPSNLIQKETSDSELIVEILNSVRIIDKKLRYTQDAEHIIYMQTILKKKIEETSISDRTKNILLNCKFKTLGELAQMDPYDLLKFRNIGRKALIEIEEELVENGLSFGMNLSKYTYADGYN